VPARRSRLYGPLGVFRQSNAGAAEAACWTDGHDGPAFA
jgi:hypothetical protein